MSIPSHSTNTPSDARVWDGLKRAIAESSGFERWKQDREFESTSSEHTLDSLVYLYLRENSGDPRLLAIGLSGIFRKCSGTLP